MLTASAVFDGPIDGVSFLAYIEQVLAPTLRPGDVVVLDNLSVQPRDPMRVDIVEEVLRAMLVRSTSARHRIRHGIRHTEALAGRGLCRCVANGRLRHTGTHTALAGLLYAAIGATRSSAAATTHRRSERVYAMFMWRVAEGRAASVNAVMAGTPAAPYAGPPHRRPRPSGSSVAPIRRSALVGRAPGSAASAAPDRPHGRGT